MFIKVIDLLHSIFNACLFGCNLQYLNQFFEQLGMLPTLFSFIWVLQMLIGYSRFLINIYLGILVFRLGIL